MYVILLPSKNTNTILMNADEVPKFKFTFFIEAMDIFIYNYH